jgi:hypothetical protein
LNYDRKFYFEKQNENSDEEDDEDLGVLLD